MRKLTKPCGACPFKKGAYPKGSNPGGASTQTYLGQARGPFWLPCHKDPEYNDKESDPNKVCQCAGAAIFRANCNDGYSRPEELLQLPSDTENVFANEVEFYEHYEDVDRLDALVMASQPLLDMYMMKELSNAQAKRMEL